MGRRIQLNGSMERWVLRLKLAAIDKSERGFWISEVRSSELMLIYADIKYTEYFTWLIWKPECLFLILLIIITRERVREKQISFRPNTEWIDQIFAMRQTFKLRHAYRRPTTTTLLDIRASFDFLDRTDLWKCLVR